jgi:hypothetical protein
MDRLGSDHLRTPTDTDPKIEELVFLSVVSAERI